MVDSSDDDQVDPVIIGRENDGLGDWNDYKPDEYKLITSLFLRSTLSHPLCSVTCSFVVQNARALASILRTFSEHIFERLRTRVLTEYMHGGPTLT